MPAESAFTLSLAAVDLLWEQLGVRTPVRIFEIPSVGATTADRDRLRQVVLADLEARDLAYRGRLEPKVEEAIVTLSGFRHAIDAVAVLDQDHTLLARAATSGQTAVLARRRDQLIVFDTFRPDGLVSEVVHLIGDAHPGPGRAVTFPETPRRHGHEPQRDAARTMWERKRLRIGMFTVYARDRHGHEHTLPTLSWFDTVDGRYLGHVRPGPDGQPWTTYAPADAGLIAHQLTSMLGALR